MSQTRSRILKGVRLAALAALGATALAVTPAWASGITWTYNVASTFDVANTQFSSGCGNASSSTSTNSATSSELIWGCSKSGTRSSLQISGSPATGSVDTDGGTAALGVVLTHNNFVIDGSHLTSTNLINDITLTPNAGPSSGTALASFDLKFGINFTETSNTTTCAVAPTDANNPCPDIFVIDNASLNHSFDYDGTSYFVSLFPAAGGVGNLGKAACHAAGVIANSCTGFVTQENGVNPLNFAMAITSQKIGVPEPGELGLMGLGLLALAGLVVLRRRRATEDARD